MWAHELGDLVRAVVQQTCCIFRSSRGVLLRKLPQNRLRVECIWQNGEFSQEGLDREFRRGEDPVLDAVLDRGEPALAPHPSELISRTLRVIPKAVEGRSMLFIPIVLPDGSVWGMVFVERLPGQAQFSAHEREAVARAVGWLAGSVLDLRLALDTLLGGTRLAQEMIYAITSDIPQLLEAARRPIPESLDHRLKRAERDADWLTFLPESLGGLPEGAKERVQLRELVDRVVEQARMIYPSCGANIKNAVPDNLVVPTHGNWAQRVVLALVENAVRHANADNITICAEPAGTELKVSVVDNGVGMDEAAMSRMFDWTVAGKRNLGAPIAKHIAELMKWGIEVESQPGRGTSVTVTIGDWQGGTYERSKSPSRRRH